MLKKIPAMTPRPAARPSIPSRNWIAFVTVRNQSTVRSTLSQRNPGIQLGTVLRITP